MTRRRGGRLSDNTKATCLARLLAWKFVLYSLSARRLRRPRDVPSLYLAYAANIYNKTRKDYAIHVQRTRDISYTVFDATFEHLSDTDSLSLFRFRKQDIRKLLSHVLCTETHWLTKRNRYTTTPLLTLCVLLRRLATPFRWRDVERFFGKHSSQLSEVFWEGLEEALQRLGYLLSGDIEPSFIQANAERYAAAIKDKTNALDNCIGFIDGTVLRIARPGNHSLQNVVYNGHKRTHALKVQAVTTPDSMFLHIAGPLEGRRHDWRLYVRSNLDNQLSQCMEVNDQQYCIFGDSGYNWRVYLEIPFQGDNISENQGTYNKAMSSGRVTVEWSFKEAKLYWTTVDFKRKLKLGEAPVGELYRAALIFTNLRNCFYPNQTSQYFNCRPPSLEEYLNWKHPVIDDEG